MTSTSKNAALYYVPSGYSTAGQSIMGIQAASEGMLQAMAQHAQADRLYAFTEQLAAGEEFDRTVRKLNPSLKTEAIPTTQVERIAKIGTLFLPGPGLSAYAWMRRRIGSDAFSLCGVTHTTASPVAMDAVTDLLTAPVEPWDALVCTSRAVRSMVSRLLESQSEYLKERFQTGNFRLPQLPVIPLGVDAARFAANPAARAAWRSKFGIAADDVAALFVGRLDPFTKAHPIPMFLAAAAAQRRSKRRQHLILAGWFSKPEVEKGYRQTITEMFPELRIVIVDGRQPAIRREIWQAADFFVSPSDNIQESFGLTPLEAMAAGLPVIASDWDGYRDTIRHEIDGFLIRTVMAPVEAGVDFARELGARALAYDSYVALTSQATAIDIQAMAQAWTVLSEDPVKRQRMGEAARIRAATEFDWSKIIPRYQELWAELEAVRSRKRPAIQPGPLYPARPNPFEAFNSYPTHFLAGWTRVSVGVTAPALIEPLLNSPLMSFVKPALPKADALKMLVEIAEAGPINASELLNKQKDPAGEAWRGIAWLIKYAFLRVE